MEQNPDFGVQDILASVGEGVYATDADRRIVYWGKGAEKITGWPAREVLGRHCSDRLLCHIDKDGHSLCGEEHCPLHRCIVTGRSSPFPVIVFAQTRTGGRVPLDVNVAPIRNADGKVVGGVETFRDLSGEFADIQRVRQIQSLALHKAPPSDGRIRFSMRYVPCDIIGGDYYGITQIDTDRYGFLLADVTGHGVAAALYTMYLSSLWERECRRISKPREFAETVSRELRNLIKEDEPFAAAICGVADLRQGELRLVGAGNPPPLVIRRDGRWEQPDACGLPLGVMEHTTYKEITLPIAPGDRILLFTDGAVEVHDHDGKCLGAKGLERILKELGYPGTPVSFAAIEERLLQFSNGIRFDDDVTFLEIRIG